MTDFKAKMHQIRFRLGLRPRPRWGSLQRSPRPPSWIWGSYFYGEGKGGREGEEREGRGGDGRRGKGGKERAMSPPLFGGSLRLCMEGRNCPPPLEAVSVWTVCCNINSWTLRSAYGMSQLSVCLSSVMFVCPVQRVKLLGSIFFSSGSLY